LIYISTSFSYFYKLKDVRLTNGKNIEYPLENNDFTISDKGIFITSSENKLLQIVELKDIIQNKETAIIACELELSPKYERDKHNNSLELNVVIESIKLLEKLEYKNAIFEFKKEGYIQSSILSYIKTVNNKELLILAKDISEKTKQLKESFELQKEKLSTKIKEIEKDFDIQKKELNQKIKQTKKDFEQENKKEELEVLKKREEIKLKFSEFKNDYTLKIKELENKKEKKEKRIKKLEEKRKKIYNSIKDKENYKESLNETINKLEEILKDKEDSMGKKLEKLRSFIKEKADNLLKLEFIDQEEYNNLLMIESINKLDEKFVDFENDLLKDKQLLISHIQAYLFEKDIIYSRYIIEDFYALIQTNDLIILAGESGSGKTNLIKSFADAIGGKSFIIPVKPNWTSSEDLLGYYNPLEKKYLSTPFLDALLEAKDNPTVPYFICLDEMNLARVEYYFADFLSLLEERGELPEIKLYSEDESAHILSEFKNVIKTIEVVKEKYKKKNIVNFIELLQDEEINRELTRIFGFSDKDSLIKYHTDLRRMLSGILNTPSSIIFPKNVRIIGAINIDETTHYLSPKILDRAHIMKFDSPLLQDWTKIANEIEDLKNKDLKVRLDIKDLGERKAYPSYNLEDEFCKIITEFTKEYFSPLGIEVGLRTIRQGLNYQNIFKEQESNDALIINNFILHKILPKMTFDGNKEIKGQKKDELLLSFKEELKKYINQSLIQKEGVDVIEEIDSILKTSYSNDGIINYWA
jgi:energy-coupling factor transporter ATP-binding protein EcfA2